MEFRQLRYFVAIAEDLHFGRAANRLQITQPALSKQIASLEKATGVPLLHRTKRTVKLTAAGRILLQQARQLLRDRETALRLVKQTGTGEIGQLSVGFTQTATQTVLPVLLNQFLQRYPQIELELQELATEAQVLALNQDAIDIAFLHPPIDTRGLCLHPILKETFMAMLPPNHPLGNCEQIPLEAFAREPLIIHPRNEGPALYDGFINVCQMAGFYPNIVKESISSQTRLCLVAAGVGISFISDRLRSLAGNSVECRPIEDCPIQLEFSAAWRKSVNNPTLANFLAILQDGSL